MGQRGALSVAFLSFKSLEVWNWWQLVKFPVSGKQPVSGALGTALLSSLFRFWVGSSQEVGAWETN